MLNNYSRFCLSNTVSTVLNEFAILRLLPEGRVIVLDTISSTNQYLIDNIKYVRSGSVVVTENQTQGRGQYGKTWITPKGQSICLSIYWKMYQKLLNTKILSIIISSVVASVLKKLGVFKIQIKWPNDLYVYNKKLAGILVEVIAQSNYFSHVIIGIGINVSISTCTKLDLKISDNWIDLNYLGIFPNRNILVVNLVKKLREVLSQFKYNKYIPKINY